MADIARKTVTFALLAALTLPISGPAHAQFGHEISNDMNKCRGNGPAVRITLNEVKSSSGTVRVQLYRGTRQDWLATGRWINRIEVPARAGTMTFCMPVPQAGNYAIATRHDINNNGKTDLTQDGGGMSNNPSINVFNLGKPGVDKVTFPVGDEVKSITIRMRYM